MRQINSSPPSPMRYNMTQARYDPYLNGYFQSVPGYQLFQTLFPQQFVKYWASKATNEGEVELTKATSIALALEVRKDQGKR